MTKQIKNIESVNSSVQNAVINEKKTMATVYGIEANVLDMGDVKDVDGLDFSALNKALRDAIKASHNFAQAIKALDGLMGLPLVYDEENTTLGELLTRCGFKVGSKNMSVKALLNGWRFKSDVGRCQIWRNVPGTIATENIVEQQNTKADSKKHNTARVYAWSEKAEKWTAVSKFALMDVADDKWSVEMILRGAVQSAFPEKMHKMHNKSEKKWNELEEVFRFEHRMDKGGEKNTAIAVKKSDVVF